MPPPLAMVTAPVADGADEEVEAVTVVRLLGEVTKVRVPVPGVGVEASDWSATTVIGTKSDVT